MFQIIESFKNQAEKTLNMLKEDLKSIRTGKANPILLENLQVEAYGGQSKLKLMELATIMTEGSAALSITPFDPSTLQDIEKAILQSALGVTPAVQGSRIIAKIPPLSQEQREKFVKLINQKVEERKNMIRALRDDARKKIKASLDAKELGKDQKFKLEKDLDNINKDLTEQVKIIKDKKEKDVMQI